jgi:fermentation-respiration switch protein FrsA (DUF1100 family)
VVCAALAVGCGVHLTVEPAPPVLSKVLQRKDANGVATWAIVPNSYDSSKAFPWIIYNHGFGETIGSITLNAPQNNFVQSLAAAGFVVVASEYRDPACWGDMECAEDIANLQVLWHSLLSLTPQPYVIGESMGGVVTWNAILLNTVKPLAVVGIYPVCSLANMYTKAEFAPTIQSAYGFDSPGEYSKATAGFDPLLAPPHVFTSFPIMIWASYSDHTVSRSKNEDPFSAAINAAGGNVVVRASYGDHGDPSNFNAPAVISFFSSNQR